MSIEQTISQIDVKRNNGSDIIGAEEKKFRDSAMLYLNTQKKSLSNEDYAKLEISIAQFLTTVDTDFKDLTTKYETLKNAIRAPRTDLKIEVHNEQIKNSAELILGSIRNTNIELTNKITELTKKEQSYLNFISPENMLGLSTRLLDGNTVTGLKLQSMNAFAERSSASEKSLGKIINDLSSGKSFTDIQKNPSLKTFFASPEGLYMIDKGNKVEDSECYQKYILNTARLYNKLNLPIIAESYYDKLDGTIFENQIKGERLSKVERFRQGGLTTFANDFLSLDQLAIMAAGGAAGKGLGLLVGKSETLTRGAIVASKAIEGSKMAKVLLPGVQVIKSGAGDKLSIAVGKGIINIGLDVTKFMAYSYAAEKIGGEDAGKAVRLALAIIPGAKAGFEAQMSMNMAKDAATQTPKLADWMITKYGKEGTENMIYTGLVEKAKAEAMKTGRLSTGLPATALQELRTTAQQTVKSLESIAASGKNTNPPELVTKAFDAVESMLNSKLNSVQKDALANAANYVQSRGPKINEINQQEVINLLTKLKGVGGSPSFTLDQANAIIKSGTLSESATKVEKVAATVATKTPVENNIGNGPYRNESRLTKLQEAKGSYEQQLSAKKGVLQESSQPMVIKSFKESNMGDSATYMKDAQPGTRMRVNVWDNVENQKGYAIYEKLPDGKWIHKESNVSAGGTRVTDIFMPHKNPNGSFSLGFTNKNISIQGCEFSLSHEQYVSKIIEPIRQKLNNPKVGDIVAFPDKSTWRYAQGNPPWVKVETQGSFNTTNVGGTRRTTEQLQDSLLKNTENIQKDISNLESKIQQADRMIQKESSRPERLGNLTPTSTNAPLVAGTESSEKLSSQSFRKDVEELMLLDDAKFQVRYTELQSRGNIRSHEREMLEGAANVRKLTDKQIIDKAKGNIIENRQAMGQNRGISESQKALTVAENTALRYRLKNILTREGVTDGVTKPQINSQEFKDGFKMRWLAIPVILAALIALHQCQGDKDPIPLPANPTVDDVLASCASCYSGSKSTLDKKRIINGREANDVYRQGVSERWVKTPDWKNLVKLYESNKSVIRSQNSNMADVMDGLIKKGGITIEKVQEIQHCIAMLDGNVSKDSQSSQDGMLGPITTKALSDYFTKCKLPQ